MQVGRERAKLNRKLEEEIKERRKVEKKLRDQGKNIPTLIDEAVKKERESIPQLVQKELEKNKALEKAEAMRYRVPTDFNKYANPDRKPGSDATFSMLRRMAILYPIARACISRRTKQITQLQWDILPIDEIEDQAGYQSQIAQVKNYFKEPAGHKTRFRDLLSQMSDDVLTLDAVCFEIERLRGGRFKGLVPVDPATIVKRVTETGATPEPPQTAYAQYIKGEKVAEFTTNEMIYSCMNSRSYSPYGLAPLESLIIQVESALRGGLYNLNYFRESNVPEGFITLPEEIVASKERVEEWQLWFDSLTAGDPRFMHRLKILPGGTEYTPVKKPEDMAFEKFELWLLQQTCAVFDVPPQDIGITYQVNKSTGETQSQIAREKGLYPLANFIKEIFDDIIQKELGFTSLQFAWQNINPVDRKEEIEVAEREIKLGALSVDEYRKDQGRDPVGLTHFVMTSAGPILVKDVLNPPKPEESEDIETPTEEVDPEKEEQNDIKRWRKCIYADLDSGRPLRTKFASSYITAENRKLIQNGLTGVKSKHQAKILFDQFLDPEFRSSMKLLRVAENLRRIEDADFLED